MGRSFRSRFFTFRKSTLFWLVFGFAVSSSFHTFASLNDVVEGIDHNTTFLFIGIMLLLAKISGLIEKWGQPGILGELGIGILLGNLSHFGFGWFEQSRDNQVLHFLSQLGLIILLFQIGLELNVKQIVKAGPRALIGEVTGIVGAFLLGAFVISPLVFPDTNFITRLFIGACMASTSIGIAAMLFKQYKQMKSAEAQIVLGSAIIDDIIGMVMFPVLTALVTSGDLSPMGMVFVVIKSVAFIVGSVYLGQLLAPHIGKIFAKINTGTGMKLTLALSIALIMAYLAHLVGMAPIIGAFAAGLFLDPVHFNNFDNPKIYKEMMELTENKPFTQDEKGWIMDAAKKNAHHHIDDLIEPLAHFSVPLFFITVGMNVNLDVLTHWDSILIAASLLLIPVIARVVGSFVAGAGTTMDKFLIGFALVPNDEVGLVFASVAKSLHVFDERVFTIVIFVQILTTLVSTVVVNLLLARYVARKNAEK